MHSSQSRRCRLLFALAPALLLAVAAAQEAPTETGIQPEAVVLVSARAAGAQQGEIAAQDLAARNRPRLTILFEAPAAGVPEVDQARVELHGGRFDDDKSTPMQLAEDPAALRASLAEEDGALALEVDFIAPPKGANAITDLDLSIFVPVNSGETFEVIEDLRSRQQQECSPPGIDPPWFKIENFGPRQLTLRRLVAEAPGSNELTFTNVRGEKLELQPMAVSTVADPVGGGWVSSFIFIDHVPLVVNLVVPVSRPAGELHLRCVTPRLELP